MKTSTNESVEIPGWARLLGTWPFAGARPGKRDIVLIEDLCIAIALLAFAVSFLVPSEPTASAVRTGAVIAFVCAYLVSVFSRTLDEYTLWPEDAGSVPDPRAVTWRQRIGEYGFLVAVGIVGAIGMYWLLF
jgi:hypothetical protein